MPGENPTVLLDYQELAARVAKLEDELRLLRREIGDASTDRAKLEHSLEVAEANVVKLFLRVEDLEKKLEFEKVSRESFERVLLDRTRDRDNALADFRLVTKKILQLGLEAHERAGVGPIEQKAEGEG